MASSPAQTSLVVRAGGGEGRTYELLDKRVVFAVTISNIGGEVFVLILQIYVLMDGISVEPMETSLRS